MTEDRPTWLKTFPGIYPGLDDRRFTIRPVAYTTDSVGSAVYSDDSGVEVNCSWLFEASQPVYLDFGGPLADGVPNWVYDLNGASPAG